MIEFRFTKLMYWLRPSPAILGSVISHHLSKYKNADISTIQDSLYADDLVGGASTVEIAFKTYRTVKTALLEGGFNLRKWSSNSREFMRRIQVAKFGAHTVDQQN